MSTESEQIYIVKILDLIKVNVEPKLSQKSRVKILSERSTCKQSVKWLKKTK